MPGTHPGRIQSQTKAISSCFHGVGSANGQQDWKQVWYSARGEGLWKPRQGEGKAGGAQAAGSRAATGRLERCVWKGNLKDDRKYGPRIGVRRDKEVRKTLHLQYFQINLHTQQNHPTVFESGQYSGCKDGLWLLTPGPIEHATAKWKGAVRKTRDGLWSWLQGRMRLQPPPPPACSSGW